LHLVVKKFRDTKNESSQIEMWTRFSALLLRKTGSLFHEKDANVAKSSATVQGTAFLLTPDTVKIFLSIVT